MNLTSIEYDVIMEAINQARSSIADDEFIDPYAEQNPEYTNKTLYEALQRVENKIMLANTPF